MDLKWVFYRDEKGEHRWRAVHPNGEILFACTEGYVRKADAQQCARHAGWQPAFQTIEEDGG